MNVSKIQILVLDQPAASANTFYDLLTHAGYKVSIALSERDALTLCDQNLFNLVLAVADSKGIDATAVMDKVRLLSPDTQFIFLGQQATVRCAIDALRAGAVDYLPKPVEPETLKQAVLKVLEHQAATAQNFQLRQRFNTRAEPNIFVGQSPKMENIGRLIREIAPTDVTTVIQGESGTGKEVIARAIHERSRRKTGPFIAVNCAALTDSIIESEFFGHVKGAFTGAIKDRMGRFQLAQGGTLFLDEIGDLSPKGQGDLLRVLEDGMFRPIGSPTALRANARIIAASNKDLEELGTEGRFREDLFYRLSIVSINVPPLRERMEDIPALVETFVRHFCAKHQRKAKRFSAQTLSIFQTLPWPGNIRQLRNIVERLVVTVSRAVIEPGDLPPRLLNPDNAEFTIRAGMTVAQVEAELIRQTLLRVASNQVEAAALLGISRRALQYKIKRYGLNGLTKQRATAKSTLGS